MGLDLSDMTVKLKNKGSTPYLLPLLVTNKVGDLMGIWGSGLGKGKLAVIWTSKISIGKNSKFQRKLTILQ